MAQRHHDGRRIERFATQRQRHLEDYYRHDNGPAIREAVEHGDYYVFDMTFSESDRLDLYLCMVMLFGPHVAI